jgi:hypothetical protein
MWDLVAENYIVANNSEQPTASIFRINDSFIMKIETIRVPVTILFIYQNTRRHLPEDRTAMFTTFITCVYIAVK